ncbi:MAG: slipin family protein [Candidatus Moranbacteria bacterium]|nr:slipin family protein [Candidatus Moranbacteria bacterium]
MNNRDKKNINLEDFLKNINSGKNKRINPFITVVLLIFVFLNILADTGGFSLIINHLKSMGTLTTLIIIAAVIILISIRQINQYQKGVKFMLGKYVGIMEPGWRLVFPIIQGYQKVDMRIKAVDVPDQEAITKDNISVTVNAVIYYKVADAEKAIIEVEDFYYAVSQLAQTTMRNVVGEVDLDELLSNRDAIAEKIRKIVDEATDAWGVKVNSVELKDVTLPEEMKRVIGKQAEAEREKRAVIIKSEGEVVAAGNISKAAEMLSAKPGSLHLRTHHTLNDLSSDQSNTVIFAVPIEVLRALEKIGGQGK